MYMINPLSDIRLQESLELLSSVLSKKDIKSGYLIIKENNTIICIYYDSIIFYSTLTLSQPNYEIIVDLNKTIEYQEENPEVPGIKTFYIPLIDFSLINKLKSYENSYLNNQFQLIYKSDYLNKDNDEFINLLSLKSDQGVRFFKYSIDNKNFCIPVFSGFPKVSKSDLLSLSVYKYDINHDFIVYDIYKKKYNRNISLMFRTLHLF